jgi:hypothetical protein
MVAHLSRNRILRYPVWMLAWMLLAPFALAQPAATKPDRAVVQPGESESAIEQSLGRPDAVVEGNGRMFLMYAEGRIVLENNQAVEIPLGLRAPVVPPPPAPALAAPPPVSPPATPAPAQSPTVAPATTAAPPAISAPATALGTAPGAKPIATAGPATPAKPAVLVPAQPEAASKGGFSVPMWVWVVVVIVLAFGALKYWDWQAARKNAPAEAVDNTPVDRPAVAREDPTMARDPPPAAVEDTPAPAEPELVRTRIAIRPRPPEPAESAPPVAEPPAPAPAEPAVVEEVPRLLKLTRKAPSPASGDEKKS